MITPMKRLSILLYRGEQTQFLSSLRDAGVVHISISKDDVSRDETIKLDKESKTLDSILKELKDNKENIEINSSKVPALVSRYLEINSELEKLDNRSKNLEKEIKTLAPWGNFEPQSIEKLSKEGVYLSFFEVSDKDLSLFSNFSTEIIKQSKSKVWLTVISEDKTLDILGVEPLNLPKVSLSSLKSSLEDNRVRESVLNTELLEISKSKSSINNYKKIIDSKLDFNNAENAMELVADSRVLSLEAWLPVDNEVAVKNVLDKFTCWYEFAEPSADDAVPVKLKNSGGPNLFEPITKIFSLPDYFEIDPTPFFAPFYALFFGLCLGDLGYGALMIIFAIIGMAVKPSLKPIMKLGVVLGFTTMFSGLLLNTVFGSQIFAVGDGAFSFLAEGQNGFAMLKPLIIDGKTVFPAMAFSVFLGMIQIILGIVLKGINKSKAGGITYALYPLGSVLLVMASTLALIKINFLEMATFITIINPSLEVNSIIGSISSNMMLIPMYLGLFLLFFFNNPDKKLGMRLPLGLWELYGFVTGLMGDALSYIRLFALGLAGGLLGKAFNDIAIMVGGDHLSLMTFFTVLIMIVGHSINFALAALGSFVHPLRLTFVEFYKNLDFKGGSEGYKPFSKIDN